MNEPKCFVSAYDGKEYGKVVSQTTKTPREIRLEQIIVSMLDPEITSEELMEKLKAEGLVE